MILSFWKQKIYKGLRIFKSKCSLVEKLTKRLNDRNKCFWNRKKTFISINKYNRRVFQQMHCIKLNTIVLNNDENGKVIKYFFF